MKKYHYLYRITNKELNKHYYGVRSSDIEPKQDLGIKYFSSSSDKEFIKEQKRCSYKFKYKIIKMFNTREEAMDEEIKIHTRLNVDSNDKFYNKINAKNSLFGYYNPNKHWIKFKTADEIREIYGRVSNKNKIIRYIQIIKYGHWTLNKSVEEVSETYMRAAEKQKQTKQTKEFKDRLANSEKFQLSKKLRQTSQLAGLNPNAKIYSIYDRDGVMIACGKGDYITTCKELGIPVTAFERYKNCCYGMYYDANGNGNALTLLNKSGNIKFKGYKVSWGGVP